MTDDLVQQAKVLADRVGAFSVAVEQLDHRTNRSEKIVVVVVAVLVLTLLLALIVGAVLIQQRETQQDVTAAVARESKTRQEGLCPLYALLLGTYKPESRPEGEARQLYIEQFQIMRTAYATLDCKGRVVPPATHGGER
jgi:hypothetical protein